MNGRSLGEFAADLPPGLRRTVARLVSDVPADSRDDNRPPAYKIAVTGGPWEYVHNRLYFYNPFAQLEGQGLFTYVPLLDHLLVPRARPAGSRRGRYFPRAGTPTSARCWTTAGDSRSPRST